MKRGIVLSKYLIRPALDNIGGIGKEVLSGDESGSNNEGILIHYRLLQETFDGSDLQPNKARGNKKANIQRSK